MSEQAREQISIDASVATCFDTLIDFEQYPSWVGDLKDVAVVERDAHDRGVLVEFRAAAMGRSTTYRLRYDYDGAPHRIGWTLAESDMTRAIDGAYRLSDGEGGGTDIEYELSIDLIMPIPGFVKRRAEDRIIKSALQALKARIESAAP